MSKASNINSTILAVRGDYAMRPEGRDRRRVRRARISDKRSFIAGM